MGNINADFTGAVVLVTGGAQGIGRAVAQAFAQAGAQLVVADVDEAAVQEAVYDQAIHGRARYFRCDVGTPQEVAALMDNIAAHEGRLDVLVSNAGIMISQPPDELPLEAWDRVLNVNLRGPFLCVKYGLRLLMKGTSPLVINIASTRALMSEPHTEAYSASKAGLLGLTHALAISLGPRIRVNAVVPGWIDVSAWKRSDLARQEPLTEADHRQHPVGRVGRPQDIAARLGGGLFHYRPVPGSRRWDDCEDDLRLTACQASDQAPRDSAGSRTHTRSPSASTCATSGRLNSGGGRIPS